MGSAIQERLADFDNLIPFRREGRISQALGTTLRARIPHVSIGERCAVRRRNGRVLLAEVVGLDEERGAVLMPLGEVEGIAIDDRVEPLDGGPRVPHGAGVRGRVLNALGEPLDGKGELCNVSWGPLTGAPPHPLRRARIARPLATGIRSIDALLTIGCGQRIGIFAQAGGGKSTLLASLTRNVDSDAVVVALIGERGREVAPFIHDNLGVAGLEKSTIVVSTSDEPALLRVKAAYTATAIAEALRAQGMRVVLLMDSVTRFARALREVGLAAGELPARRGFPPSVFASLPQLFERAGNGERGSITAFYTVLVEADLADDPVAEETRSLLDGHLVLTDELARRQHYPALDVLASKSRLMNDIVPSGWSSAARSFLSTHARYEENRAKVDLGLYEPGMSDEIDRAIELAPRMSAFLKQSTNELSSLDQTLRALSELTGIDTKGGQP